MGAPKKIMKPKAINVRLEDKDYQSFVTIADRYGFNATKALRRIIAYTNKHPDILIHKDSNVH